MRRGHGEPRCRQPKARKIFPRAVAQILGHPLALDAEHHDDIGAADSFVDRPDRAGQVGGHQRRRPGEAKLDPQATEQFDVRSCHTAVLEVPANRDLQTRNPPEMLANRRRVEQCLRRMLANPVAGIDHRAVHDRGYAGGRPHVAVADDQRVGAHRIERARGIFQRLALLDARLFDLHRHRLRAEAIGGNFERQQRPRRIFEKGVDDGQPVEPFGIAPWLAIIGEPARALVEDQADLRVGEIVDREQMHEGVG